MLYINSTAVRDQLRQTYDVLNELTCAHDWHSLTCKWIKFVLKISVLKYWLLSLVSSFTVKLTDAYSINVYKFTLYLYDKWKCLQIASNISERTPTQNYRPTPSLLPHTAFQCRQFTFPNCIESDSQVAPIDPAITIQSTPYGTHMGIARARRLLTHWSQGDLKWIFYLLFSS